jgi:hypothetical protein
MRSRASLSLLALILLLTIVACSSKPASESAANSADQNAASSNAGGNMSSPSDGSTQGGTNAAAEQPVVIPAGTTITVRLSEALGSKISSPGQSFTATLAVPIEVDGSTAIRSGATVRGTVTDAKPLGRFKGGAVLQIRLNTITANGRDHAIRTSSLTRVEKGKGKRTAVMAGGGAAVGALIGGLAGGGKGAAIGAVAGGGGGTAGAAYTGNKDVVLPAESAVSFRLEAPLELK